VRGTKGVGSACVGVYCEYPTTGTAVSLNMLNPDSLGVVCPTRLVGNSVVQRAGMVVLGVLLR
jgi:hypothetical protein